MTRDISQLLKGRKQGFLARGGGSINTANLLIGSDHPLWPKGELSKRGDRKERWV